MIEVRIHGRGGQGAVVATSILAAALFYDGKYALAFPAFGLERRGAPVEAYIRVDAYKVHLRTNVYTPDHVLVLDPSILDRVDVIKGLKPGGTILVNTPAKPESYAQWSGYRVATVDADRVALAHKLGSPSQPIVNTAILGAFANATGLVTLDSVCKAIGEEVPLYPERNVAAAREAWSSVVALGDNRVGGAP